MNVEELAQNLNKITARLPEGQADQIRQLISASRTKTIGLVSTAAADTSVEGSFGGRPLLPPYFKWPDDRYGQSMVFLAQFDLSQLPHIHKDMPQNGLLTLFRSAAATSMNSKDRKSFNIHFVPESDRKSLVRTEQPEDVELTAYSFKSGVTYTVCEDLEPIKKLVELPFDTEAEMTKWLHAFNSLSHCQAQLFGSNVSNFAQLQETCAFAFNGISYNSTRAADSHYSHLIEEASQWLLLARINERELFGAEHGVNETVVLMRAQDLIEAQFERAWMVVRGTNKAKPDQG